MLTENESLDSSGITFVAHLAAGLIRRISSAGDRLRRKQIYSKETVTVSNGNNFQI